MTVLPGENPLLTIELIDGRHLTAPTTGYLVERNDDGIVAAPSPTFTFEFRDGDTMIPIEGIEGLANMLPEDPEDNIADLFEVSGAGRIVAKDAAALFKSIEQGSGGFAFPSLPRGTFTLKAEKVVDGRYYHVDEIIVLDEDKNLNVPFVHYSDPARDRAAQ